jgi:hypothetical protein
MEAQMPEQTKTTLAAWKKNKRHTITLPSQTVVEIELPNIQLLLKTGQVPNPLVQLVTRASTDPNFTLTPELLTQQWDFTSWVVARTVVNPTLKEEEVADLPVEDVEMITDFAMRNRDIDAVGHHLGGLETVNSFRRLRGFDVGGADGAGL